MPTCAGTAARSVWYAYWTPASGSVTANIDGTYASLAVCCGTSLSFSLRPAPDPIAAFWFSPPDPSIFDAVAFVGQSQDPGQAGFAAEEFDFGDGSSADGCCPATPWDTTRRTATPSTATTR